MAKKIDVGTEEVWNSLPLPPQLVEKLSGGGSASSREGEEAAELSLPKGVLPTLKQNLSYYFGSGASERLILQECADRFDDRDSDIALRQLDAKETAEKRSKVYILFVVDATGSMDNFARSLEATLTQVLSILNVLFFNAAKLSLFVYTDYNEGVRRLLRVRHGMDLRHTLKFVSSLKPQGGGDWAEASKTAFVEVLEYIKRLPSESRSNCVVVHYTDAPPHHTMTRQKDLDNAPAEARALEMRRREWERKAKKRRERESKDRKMQNRQSSSSTTENMLLLPDSHPGYDWVRICHHFALHSVAVYTMTPREAFRIDRTLPFFALLARASGGKLLTLDNTEPRTITRATMGILLMLMDQPFDRFEHIYEVEFENVRQIDRYFARPLATVENGTEDEAQQITSHLLHARVATDILKDNGDDEDLKAAGGATKRQDKESNASSTMVSVSTCKLRYRPFGKIRPAYFMKRQDLSTLKCEFYDRKEFRAIVFQALHALVIPTNVMSLTYNEILGSLWRLACSRRDDKRLQGLQGKMGHCVQNTKELSGEERATLREWLESSFDYSHEIQEEITRCECDEMLDPKDPSSDSKENTTKDVTLTNLDCREDRNRLEAFDFFAMSSELDGELPSVRDLRSVMHAPTSQVLKKIQAMLSNIVVYRGNRRERPIDAFGRKRYLPCSMSGRQIFRLLPHLVHGGTRFSLKPACIVALLVVRSGHSDLAPKADRFLRQVKGTWLPPVEKIDRAELLSESFVTFFASVKNKVAYFTKAERDFYERIYRIWRLRCAGSMYISLQMPFVPDHHRRIPDEKVLCRRCKTYASRTLVDARSETCGLCLWEMKSPKNRWTRPNASSKLYCGRDESFIAQCGTCLSLYAVVGIDDLGISPKCHFCRSGKRRRRCSKSVEGHATSIVANASDVPPAVRCTTCKNLWLRPGLTETEIRAQSETFVCQPCLKNPETLGGFRSVQIRLADILRENPRLLPMAFGFRKGLVNVLFPLPSKKAAARVSLFTLVTRHRTLVFGESRKVHDRAALVATAVFNIGGKRVGESSSVLCENVRRNVDKRSLSESCMLCFEHFNIATLRPACGNCRNLCCASCLRTWYSKNKPGCLFLLAQATCPFCRSEPTFEVLREYNRDIFDLHNRRESLSRMRSRVDMYFAWCTQCQSIQDAMPRRCTAGTPQMRAFVCSRCSEADELRRLEVERQKRIRKIAWQRAPCVANMYLRLGKRCPGCKNMVVKTEGCNHITCGCGAVWCWACGHRFKDGWKFAHGCESKRRAASAKRDKEKLLKLKKDFMGRGGR